MCDTLSQWLLTSKGSDEPVSTCHFHTLNVGWHPGLRGLEVLQVGVDTLSHARRFLAQAADQEQSGRLVLYLPLGSADVLTPWAVHLWDALGTAPEPPSLYLLRTPMLFEEHDEAYGRTVDVQAVLHDPVSAIYRCFRSEEHRQLGWAFTLGLYLF